MRTQDGMALMLAVRRGRWSAASFLAACVALCLAAPSGMAYSQLTSVAATSARNAWAVGNQNDHKALIEHWNGSAWKIVPTGIIGELMGVVAISPRDVWAVGDAGAKPLVAHWNGSAWKAQTLSNTPYLHAISASSPGDVWVVGGEGDSG